MNCTVINLEQGMPTVENAVMKLEQALRTAKARRVSALKLIHGYGSSGRGGAIRQEVQRILSGKKRSGAIRNFVPGDRFSPFDPDARDIVAQCPALAKDRDYTKANHGITIVLL